MKKIFLGLVLLFGMANMAQARFFLGADASYSLEKATRGIYKSSGNGYFISASLGTEHYFGESQIAGLRWYLGGGYGRSIFTDANFTNFNLKLGLDLLIDIVKFQEDSALTFFAGLQSGFLLFTSLEEDPRKETIANNNYIPLYVSAGLSLKLASYHRLELGALIPVADLLVVDGEGSKLYYDPYRFSLGYKFVF